MAGDEEAVECVCFFANFIEAFFGGGAQHPPFHLFDFVIGVNDGLVAEDFRLIDAFDECVVDPVGHGEGLFDGIEDGEQVHFLCGADFETVEAGEAFAAAAFVQCGGVARAIVIGKCDAIHAALPGYLSDGRGCHLQGSAW